MKTDLLNFTTRILAIAQAGLAFSKDEYDQERYEEIQMLSKKMAAACMDSSYEQIQLLLEKESGYPTPKSDVRGAVFREGKLLLVQENRDGLWSLPGGFCEVGLSPAENVCKEIEEEAGFQTAASNLWAVHDMQKRGHEGQLFHYYKLFFHCEITGGEALSGLETQRVQFFGPDELPDLSTRRNTYEQIALLFEKYESSSTSCSFD